MRRLSAGIQAGGQHSDTPARWILFYRDRSITGISAAFQDSQADLRCQRLAARHHAILTEYRTSPGLEIDIVSSAWKCRHGQKTLSDSTRVLEYSYLCLYQRRSPLSVFVSVVEESTPRGATHNAKRHQVLFSQHGRQCQQQASASKCRHKPGCRQGRARQAPTSWCWGWLNKMGVASTRWAGKRERRGGEMQWPKASSTPERQEANQARQN